MPAHIAWLAIAYSVLTWAGMLVFGRDVWLQHGEVFSLVFGTFARFAPTRAAHGPQRALLLRPFGAGLLDSRPVSTSMMAFVLLLLATVLYDGALGTPRMGASSKARWPPSSAGLGDLELMAMRTVGPASPSGCVFLGAYLGI